MRKFYRFHINKELVKKDFKTITKFCKKYDLNWAYVTRGTDSISSFGKVPKKYIVERNPSKIKIYVRDDVIFVWSVDKSTHTLKVENGEVVLCQSR